MSDTTTPASVVVAEIIGWTETTEVDVIGLRGWHRPGCVGYDPGVCECMGKPTPDDMLAFLASRGYKLSAAWWCDVEGYLLEFDQGPLGMIDLPPNHERPQHIPTLHAALEAAVIAVGRAE